MSKTIIIEKKIFIKLIRYFLKYSCQLRFDNDTCSISMHMMEKMSYKKMDRHIDNLYNLCSKTRKMKYIN